MLGRKREVLKRMQNMLAIWNGLTNTRKAMLVGVVIVTFGAFALMISAASKPRLALLYAGLEPAAAGEILTALEGMDTIAEVRGDAIFVTASSRDATRLALAERGLPQQGQPGFELLDNMNGFATTSELFDATYWRAKKGELARTITATPGVKSARVHIAAPKTSSFARARRKARASVTVTMSRGVLDMQQAMAIRYLVALAVPELDEDQVVVIDAARGMLLKPGAAQPETFAGGADESDRIQRLEAGLLEILEAHVGAGNARVAVSIEVYRTHEKVSERVLDPQTRVLISRDAQDSQESDTASRSAVTVASNLPDGDANAAPGGDKSQRAETRETARYDISSVERQRETAPGAVARVNVAVLVNETVDAETGEPNPRSPDELRNLKELVAAAVGYNEGRGDIIAVKSMPFQQVEEVGGIEATSGLTDHLRNNLGLLLQVAIPAIVVVILGLFVIRPVLRSSAAAPETLQIAAGVNEPANVEPLAQSSPVDELRQIAATQRAKSTKVLKSWLGETENAA